MSNPLPNEQQVDALKLDADAYVELFEVTLRPSGKIYLKANNTATWQGKTWEGIAIKMTGVGQSADEKVNRPKLQVVNPHGVFKSMVQQRRLDRATVSRYRVLKPHFLADVNLFRRQTWFISRVAAMDSQIIGLELRDTTDGPNFILPARRYEPPEFPVVSVR